MITLNSVVEIVSGDPAFIGLMGRITERVKDDILDYYTIEVKYWRKKDVPGSMFVRCVHENLLGISITKLEETKSPKQVFSKKVSASPLVENREKGYTGDTCTQCGSLQMRRNGSCLLCENCGSTSGCS